MLEEVENDVGTHRGVRRDEVSARTVERADVSLAIRAANDLDVRMQFATIDGEVNVRVVVAGCDDDRGGVGDVWNYSGDNA